MSRGPPRVLAALAAKAPSWHRGAGFSAGECYAQLDERGSGGLSHNPCCPRPVSLAFVRAIEFLFVLNCRHVHILQRWQGTSFAKAEGVPNLVLSRGISRQHSYLWAGVKMLTETLSECGPLDCRPLPHNPGQVDLGIYRPSAAIRARRVEQGATNGRGAFHPELLSAAHSATVSSCGQQCHAGVDRMDVGLLFKTC